MHWLYRARWAWYEATIVFRWKCFNSLPKVAPVVSLYLVLFVRPPFKQNEKESSQPGNFRQSRRFTVSRTSFRKVVCVNWHFVQDFEGHFVAFFPLVKCLIFSGVSSCLTVLHFVHNTTQPKTVCIKFTGQISIYREI